MKLKSFVEGSWFESSAAGAELTDAVTGETVAEISSDGVDFAAMAEYARHVGGTKLREYTFHQRAEMLGALAKFLNDKKPELYALSTSTGATRTDSWLDIDGGIGTLFVYSSKGRREMPNDHIYIDGPPEVIGKEGTFIGQHIFVPLRGLALHINAFNFPCWGMLEKLGPSLLAGVPAIVKPASSTAYLTAKVFEAIVESNILPEGAVQLICGSTGNLIDHLNCQDVVAFTGSKSTADHLRQHPNIIAQSVRFTAEADSLNASVLGSDAKPGTPEFDLYVKEVVKEMTIKAGQKCTAIRRIIAPENVVGDLIGELSKRLAEIKVGHPGLKDTDMGPLAGLDQREEVRTRIGELSSENEMVFGDLEKFTVTGADKKRGAFLAPILLQSQNPMSDESVHSTEAFGPVSTVVPYSSIDNAVELANRGEGSLVGSIFTHDNEISKHLIQGIAPYHGRVLLMNRDCAKESTGHGSPLPHLVHGGPGRAGGGEELGGIRGVLHYMQRTAIQGSPASIGLVTESNSDPE